MTKLLIEFIPILIMAMSIIPIAITVKYWEWSTKRARKKSPLTSDLLRSPGYSLRLKIDDLSLNLFGYCSLILLFPQLFYSMYFSKGAFGIEVNQVDIWICVFFIALSYLYFTYLFIRDVKVRRKLVVGYEAELAVGQELNHLMRDGYWVYHDFPAENFNIDHVIVGPNGVFAIETKGRPKQKDKSGLINGEVFYDGKSLKFPSWTEKTPIEQANRQAEWLEKWLTSAVGEPISVGPVIALPGWYIKKSTNNCIPVINGKNPSPIIKNLKCMQINDKLIKQIIHVLDGRCRDVSARAYRITDD